VGNIEPFAQRVAVDDGLEQLYKDKEHATPDVYSISQRLVFLHCCCPLIQRKGGQLFMLRELVMDEQGRQRCQSYAGERMCSLQNRDRIQYNVNFVSSFYRMQTNKTQTARTETEGMSRQEANNSPRRRTEQTTNWPSWKPQLRCLGTKTTTRPV
jgi:hypothetical protein